ncbi:hypothetical protein KY338_06805 [Candidatus Woesearchaeota archaeon]|nr:hypothetical protein [Candidatus Woesearchaeota archaeon]MBW3006386.1 hypothetical protein [Candidatus Woesearchaeota archaeon]
MKIMWIFVAGCLMFAIALMQVSTTGMYQFAEYKLQGYPYYFFTGHTFNAFIIKGAERGVGEMNAANLIINEIPNQYRLLSRTKYGEGYYQIRVFPEALLGSVKIYGKDRFDYRMKNGIVIGTPCNNQIVSWLLEINNCETFFNPGEGMIKLVEANGHIYVVITGYGDDEVWATANLFVDMVNRGTIKGTEVRTNLKSQQQRIQVPDLQIGETIGKRLPAVY